MADKSRVVVQCVLAIFSSKCRITTLIWAVFSSKRRINSIIGYHPLTFIISKSLISLCSYYPNKLPGRPFAKSIVLDSVGGRRTCKRNTDICNSFEFSMFLTGSQDLKRIDHFLKYMHLCIFRFLSF